jgi:hypothetical protein
MSLRLDWCSHEAAKYAVEKWHYSRRMVATIQKPVKVGVWEGGAFIGAVVFGCGASSSLGAQFGVGKQEVAELVRVALRSDHKTPVSRIAAIAIRMLKGQSPGLRLLISFADPHQGHNGGIYQAGNWIYTGTSDGSTVYIAKDGHEFHSRNIGSYTGYDKYGVKKYSREEMVATEERPGKHRYLYPLDAAMRTQIEPLRKPYPKRAGSIVADAPAIQAGEGGAVPTPALQLDTTGVDDGS